MLTLENIRKGLEGIDIRALSGKLEIHEQTLYRIKRGENKNPTYEIVKKLSDYLEAECQDQKNISG